MRAGDLVRFRQCTFHGTPKAPKVYSEWKIGLLLKYESWYKIAKISYNGQIVSVHGSDAEIHQQAKRKRKN